MLCSVVRCYRELLHGVQCCYTLHCLVEFCAAVLNVVMCSCMLCILHVVQCCYMLPRVITCCAVLLDVTRVITCCAVLLHVTKSFYMMCNDVTCYLELLRGVQCCYVLSPVITCCAVLLHVALCC